MRASGGHTRKSKSHQGGASREKISATWIEPSIVYIYKYIPRQQSCFRHMRSRMLLLVLARSQKVIWKRLSFIIKCYWYFWYLNGHNYKLMARQYKNDIKSCVLQQRRQHPDEAPFLPTRPVQQLHTAAAAFFNKWIACMPCAKVARYYNFYI